MRRFHSPFLFRHKVALWVVLSLFAALAVFSFLLYLNMAGQIAQAQKQGNQEQLVQAIANIDNNNNAVKSIASSMLADPDVVYLMYNSHPDYLRIARSINRIRAKMAYPFAKAIYVYNGALGAFQTTNEGLYYQNPALLSDLRGYVSAGYQGRPYQAHMPVYNKTVDTLCYSFFESDGSGQIRAAFLLFCDPLWMIGNNDRLYIRDARGNFIGRPNLNDHLKETLMALADQNSASTDAGNEGQGTFLSDITIDGQRARLSCMTMRQTGWQLFLMTHYDRTQSDRLINTLLITAALALLISLLAAVFASRSISRPVDALIRTAIQDEALTHSAFANDILMDSSNGRHVSDLDRLSLIYRNTHAQIRELKDASRGQYTALRVYFLRQLLAVSAELASEYPKMREEYAYALSGTSDVCVIIAAIDGYTSLARAHTAQDRTLMRFAMCNVGQELFSSFTSAESIDMKVENVAFLVDVCKQDDFEGCVAEACGMLREFMKKHFDTSISTFVSQARPLPEISSGYNEAMNAIQMRYFLGWGCHVVPHMVRSTPTGDASAFDSELKKKLLPAVQKGDYPAAKTSLENCMNSIERLDYTTASLSVLMLLHALATFDQNKEDAPKQFQYLLSRVHGYETLAEVRAQALSALEFSLSHSGETENTKHIMLVEAIIEMVDADYRNPSLCLTSIANTLKLSGAHVSHVFKQIRGESLPQYIVFIRLTRAAERIENSQESISEIAANVGIDNAAYFYKLFRKQYGVTPMAYRLKHAVDQFRE